MSKGLPQASCLCIRQSPIRGIWAWRLGISLVNGQTEAEAIPSQGGHGDALLRHMPLPPLPELTCTGMTSCGDCTARTCMCMHV